MAFFYCSAATELFNLFRTMSQTIFSTLRSVVFIVTLYHLSLGPNLKKNPKIFLSLSLSQVSSRFFPSHRLTGVSKFILEFSEVNFRSRLKEFLSFVVSHKFVISFHYLHVNIWKLWNASYTLI